jgi:hypothetical protein
MLQVVVEFGGRRVGHLTDRAVGYTHIAAVFTSERLIDGRTIRTKIHSLLVALELHTHVKAG